MCSASESGSGIGSGSAAISCSATAAKRDAGERAERREHQALGEQLTDQPAAARADRQADADLLLPARGARQQHVGDVRARDQQHQPDRDHQSRGAIGRSSLSACGWMRTFDRRDDRALVVGLRIVGREPAHDDLQVRVGARRRFAVLQPSLEEQPALAAPIEPGGAGRRRHDVLDARRLDFLDPRDRRPHLGLQHRHHAGERRRRDADDRIGLPVDQQRAAEHAGIAGVVALPEAVGNDRRPRRARSVVVGQQRPAERRLHAEHLEVVAAHDFAERHPRAIAGLERADRRAVAERCPVNTSFFARKSRIVGVGVGGVGVAVAAARVDVHQAVRPVDTGSGRKSSASTMEKSAVLKPMPIASDRIATAANPGLRSSHFSA